MLVSQKLVCCMLEIITRHAYMTSWKKYIKIGSCIIVALLNSTMDLIFIMIKGLLLVGMLSRHFLCKDHKRMFACITCSTPMLFKQPLISQPIKSMVRMQDVPDKCSRRSANNLSWIETKEHVVVNSTSVLFMIKGL